jgi:GT2 family glycosyltransferase
MLESLPGSSSIRNARTLPEGPLLSLLQLQREEASDRAVAPLPQSGDYPPPAVSIIIPSFNRSAILCSTLRQFLKQPFENYEIWIIDQSDPDDATSNSKFVAEISDPRLNYLYLTQRGPSNARNEGLARARGEIILFTDDDVILLTGDFIGAHLRAYDDPRIGGITGRHIERVLRINAKNTACHVARSGRTIFNLFGTERAQVGSCKGSNMSFRMAAIRQVGGFDRGLKFLEETDLSTRIRKAGWHLMFEPSIEVFHLSAPAGGVRENDRLQAELVRFECTAYYIIKHRGWAGTVPFAATFALIAGLRAIRSRSLKTFPILLGAMYKGFSRGRMTPDQQIPDAQSAAG